MSRLSKILRRGVGDGRTFLTFWCPGCDTAHGVIVAGPGAWGWNGDVHRPTFTPSVLVRFGQGRDGVEKTCHSFVADGSIDFLGDSTNHQLRGKHPIPEWPHPQWTGSEPAESGDPG